MKISSLSSRKLQLAFGFAISAVLIMSAVSYHMTILFRDSDKQVWHSHEVIDHIQRFISEIRNVESAYRGFALTGSGSYIESSHASMQSVLQDEASVRELTADNPKQQQQLPILEGLTTQEIQFANMVIGLRQTDGLQAAADAIRTGLGQQTMDKIQTIVRDVHDEELRLLVLRGAAVARHLSQTQMALIIGLLLVVTITIAAGWRDQRDTSKRELAEAALRNSEEQYRLLLYGVQDYAIFMLDPQGLIVTWNAGAERIKGYTSDDIIGHSFACFFPPEDIRLGRPSEILRLTAATGRHEEHGMRVRKDGSQFLATVIFTALRNRAGELRGFSEISRDLSETKESGAKYRGLLEAAPDAMVVVNQDGEIVLVNVQAEKQFRYHRDELIGRTVKSIIPEGFSERLIADGRRSTADALAQQIGMGIELYGRRRDGTEFPIEIMLSPLESAGTILVTAAIRDISVRRAADEHLAQMEGRYRGLLEAAPDAMVVVNDTGEIILVNVQAEKQFGYSRDELLGQKIENIIPEGFAERLLADGRRSTADALAQQIGTGIELLGRRRDGSEFPIEIMLSPLESAGAILVTAAIRDITDRRLIEQQLAQAQKMEAIGNLTGGMAHDFNNGLAVIIGNLDLLGRLVKTNRNAAELCNEAHGGALRCADLIRRLLAFARRQPLRRQQTDVNALIESTAELLSRTLGEDIAVKLDLGTALPSVVVDPAQLEAALTNLANNARDAMPRGGRLEIATAAVELDAHYAALHPEFEPGAYVLIEVSDTGTGVAPDIIGRIFEPFFTTKLSGRGSGLGLSMVFGFVKQSGGHLTVYSELGLGSTFRLYLPRGEAGAMIPVKLPNADAVVGGNETILIVEDNVQLRRIAERQLTELGYQVRKAEHAAAALVTLSGETHLDMLITDVVMPGTMNGLDLAYEAARMRPGMKILLTSGFPRMRGGDQRMVDNPFPLLSKPYHHDELARTVREMLDRNEDQVPAPVRATAALDASVIGADQALTPERV